jgi:hypothetical protein
MLEQLQVLGGVRRAGSLGDLEVTSLPFNERCEVVRLCCISKCCWGMLGLLSLILLCLAAFSRVNPLGLVCTSALSFLISLGDGNELCFCVSAIFSKVFDLLSVSNLLIPIANTCEF